MKLSWATSVLLLCSTGVTALSIPRADLILHDQISQNDHIDLEKRRGGGGGGGRGGSSGSSGSSSGGSSGGRSGSSSSGSSGSSGSRGSTSSSSNRGGSSSGGSGVAPSYGGGRYDSNSPSNQQSGSSGYSSGSSGYTSSSRGSRGGLSPTHAGYSPILDRADLSRRRPPSLTSTHSKRIKNNKIKLTITPQILFRWCAHPLFRGPSLTFGTNYSIPASSSSIGFLPWYLAVRCICVPILASLSLPQ